MADSDDSPDEPSREELETRISDLENQLEDAESEGAEPDAEPEAESQEYSDEAMQEIKRLRKERREDEVSKVRSAVEGKVPAAKVDAFADLARSLPDTVETATFADDDTEEEVSPRQKLAALLSDLPEMVESGEMDFSDFEPNGEDEGDLASEM